VMNKKKELLEPLCDFWRVLTIDIEWVKISESREKIVYHNPDLKLGSIRKLTEDDLKSVFERWKDNFECDITFYAGTFTLRYDSYKDELSNLLETIQDEDSDVDCTLDFIINKERFLRDEYGEIPYAQILLYLFRDNILTLLRGNFEDIEEILFSDVNSRTVVMVLDTDIYASGDYIAFIGGRFTESQWGEILPEKSPNFELFEKLRKIREDETKWIRIDTNLTPLHFYIEHIKKGNIISELINTIFLDLIILYLANQAKFTDKGMIATFEGTGNVSIELSKYKSKKEPGNLRYLRNMFLWAYSDNASDKLSFIRNIISLSLGTDPSKNYGMLVEKAEHIYNAVKSNYRIYISKTIEKYFRIRKEAIDYVSSISQQFSTQISQMISSLINSMLAAVVAVVGAFLSYAISPQFSLVVFNYGLKAYAIYVLLFPCSYVMLHAFSEYRVLVCDFGERELQFSEFMEEGDMDKIIRSAISRRRKQFKIWFCLTLIVYVLVITGAWIFSNIDIIEWLGI
jgi:hypothetical protein